MNIEKDNRNTLVISDGDRKIIFDKHPYLPEYNVTLELGAGNGNAAGLKFTRDAVAWVFTETPCIMLRGQIDKNNTASKVFSHTVPWEQYGETNKFWLFRCGIQYWMDNAKNYDTSKAEKKRL